MSTRLGSLVPVVPEIPPILKSSGHGTDPAVHGASDKALRLAGPKTVSRTSFIKGCAPFVQRDDGGNVSKMDVGMSVVRTGPGVEAKRRMILLMPRFSAQSLKFPLVTGGRSRPSLRVMLRML